MISNDEEEFDPNDERLAFATLPTLTDHCESLQEEIEELDSDMALFSSTQGSRGATDGSTAGG
jgi:hypothetical protein